MIRQEEVFVFPITYERVLLHRPNANIVITAHLTGLLDEQELLSAIKKARIRHPLIGTKVYLDSENKAWLVSKNVPANGLQVIENCSKPWNEVAVNQFKKSFNWTEGPLCRFVLLKQQQHCYLLIVCHHLIADGLSMIMLLKDLLAFMKDHSAECQIVAPVKISSENLPADFSINPMGKLIVNRYNRKWRKESKAQSEFNYEKLVDQFWKIEKDVRILNFELNQATVQKIVSKCHQQSIGVNSFICAAFYLADQAMRVENSSWARTAYIPVNIRNRLKGGADSFGLLASAVKIKLPEFAKDDIWQLSNKINMLVYQKLGDRHVFGTQLLRYADPSLMDSVYYSKYKLLDSRTARRFSKLIQNDTISASLDISNLGRLNITTDTDSFKLLNVFGPCIYVDYHEKYIGINTLNNIMNISITYRENPDHSIAMEKLVTVFCDIVDRA